MANASGKEASLHAASCQLQALPDNGDQPQSKPHSSLNDFQYFTETWCSPKFVSLQSLSTVFFLGACESTSCWPYLCVRTSSWCQGQHAQNIQQHSCGSHVQGDLLENNYNIRRFNQQSIVINTVCVHVSKQLNVFIYLLLVYRLLMSALVSTSCWLGSMQSSRSVYATHHLAGPKNMSLESLTCVLPVTLLTPGLMTLLRLEFQE